MFFFLEGMKLNKLSDFKHFDGGDNGSSFILQTIPCIMQRLLKAVKMLFFNIFLIFAQTIDC